MLIFMKKISIHLAIFVAGVFLGMVIFKNKWFPRPQLVQLKRYFIPPPAKPLYSYIDKIVTPYTSGLPLFTDRVYYDTIGDKRLESLYLLQIPRHIKFPIEIELHKKANVYRLLTDSNDNDMFDDWNMTDIKTYVEGASCSHTSVVYKTFDPGRIILQPGGPAASSPILIEDLTNTLMDVPFTILNRRYTNQNQVDD